MNFEDSYGCMELFKRSNSSLKNPQGHIVDLVGDLGNAAVFDISKRIIKNYDYVIIVFDMDEPKTDSLTSAGLHKNLSNIWDGNGNIKEIYKNKIILVPVFYAYESLLFYYRFVRSFLGSFTQGYNEPTKLLELYKQYYNYADTSAENLLGIMHNLEAICNGVEQITKVKSSKEWFPQTFHKSYSKQTLKCIFKSLNLSDKLFDKREKQLFSEIEAHPEIGFSFNDWINDIIRDAKLNKPYAKLLSMQDLNELSQMTIECNLSKINKTLDDYNTYIKRKRSIGKNGVANNTKKTTQEIVADIIAQKVKNSNLR